MMVWVFTSRHGVGYIESQRTVHECTGVIYSVEVLLVRRVERIMNITLRCMAVGGLVSKRADGRLEHGNHPAPQLQSHTTPIILVKEEKVRY